MVSRKGDVFTGDDFLAGYQRLTKQESQQPEPATTQGSSRDLTKGVIKLLLEGAMTFDTLQARTGSDFLELSDVITRLRKVSAVEVSGTGPTQTIRLTDHGHDLAGLVTSAS